MGEKKKIPKRVFFLLFDAWKNLSRSYKCLFVCNAFFAVLSNWGESQLCTSMEEEPINGLHILVSWENKCFGFEEEKIVEMRINLNFKEPLGQN